MYRLIFAATAILLVTFSTSPSQAAGLSLDKVIVDFRPGEKPVDNLKVTNQTEQPLKITANTVKVLNGGMPNQEEIPVTNELVVAPRSFELAPGETRTVRLVVPAFPEDRELDYRIRFSPDKPTMVQTQESGDKSVQLNIIVSMGALVMVAPKNPKPDLKFERAGEKIRFTNAGNIAATLQRENFCTPDKSVCAMLEGERLFPGATKEMNVPEALRKLSFTQTVFTDGKYSTLSYPAP